jgi:hypothetical protein
MLRIRICNTAKELWWSIFLSAYFRSSFSKQHVGFTQYVLHVFRNKKKTEESLQSHFILTMSHWPSGLTLCFPSQGTWVQIPWGGLCDTGILLLALSRYIGDPDVIVHQCSLIWGGLRPKTVTRLSCRQCDNPTWHSFSVPVSCLLPVLLPASQPTESAAGGEPWREPAISLHSHHVSLAPVTRDLGSNPLGGLMWNRDSPVSVV